MSLNGQSQSACSNNQCALFLPLCNGSFEATDPMTGWVIHPSSLPAEDDVTSFVTPGRNGVGKALLLTVGAMYLPEKILNQGPQPGEHNASSTVWLRDGFLSEDGFHAYIGGEYYLLRNTYMFKKGRTYEGSVYLKSTTDSVTVVVNFRRANPLPVAGVQEVYAIQRVTVGPQWQHIEIKGGFDGLGADANGCIPGYFEINFLTSGTLTVDDASIIDITEETLSQAVPGQVIPSTFFGLHINKFGVTENNPRPAIGFGLLRLWATVTHWEHLEPVNNSWSWDRIEGIVDLAKQDPSTELIYTLGMTPAWAAKYPGLKGVYDDGTASEPSNMADWVDYVATVGNRFKGKIKYYELWNETDFHRFWGGGVAKMIDLLSAAYTTLKAIDSDIQILSPNITYIGLPWLEEFLARGGGNYVDIYSYHYYPTGMIEDGIPVLEGIKSVLDRRPSESNKPLWNTEGAIVLDTAELFPPQDSSTISLEKAAVSRSYIVQWVQGIENFSWYMWENQQVDAKRTNPSLSVTTDGWKTVDVAPAGVAYQTTRNWLVGSTVTSKTVSGIDNDTWKVEITKSNGDIAWIAWTTTLGAARSISVPGGWGTTRITDLGANDTTSTAQTISIGIEPILLEPDSNEVVSGRRRSAEEEKIVTASKTDIAETAFQVYPNPSTGKVTIEYELAEETDVNISVRDSYGRQIAELVNTHQTPGHYSTTFNKETMANGVYFCESKTNKVRVVTKMIVMH